ncbi:hypothetical protein KFE25_010128 [Diacronema lutheri]|uniref:Protein kinase domain-containing protein n=1 Tax=Diacronema lutheri TaxID=2081491 RepID=A0A8J5XKG9_DIALT|nr:hypothetical protein KFE25_010128 [Diacronema lutheri]
MPLARWRFPFRLKLFSHDWLRKGPQWMRSSMRGGTFTVDARPWSSDGSFEESEPMVPSKRLHRDLDLDVTFDDEPAPAPPSAPVPCGAVAPLRAADAVPGATGAKARKVVHHYELGELLGRGTYGKVKRAVDTRTGTEYAVKIVKKSFLKRQRRFDANSGEYASAYEDVLREVAILKKLSHANVVRLHEVIDDPEMDKMYLVLELVRGGPALGERPAPHGGPGRPALGARRPAPVGEGEGAEAPSAVVAHPTCARQPLSEADARRCVSDVLAGLEYLHFQGIVHRDLKPENILRDSRTGRFLICDLGVSLLADDGVAAGSAGTPAYSPPEVLRRDADCYSGRAADVWSLGVTMFELLTGRLPFDADGLDGLVDAVSTQPLPLPPPGAPDALPNSACDLLRRMTRKAPAERISIADARKHPWVTAGGEHTRPSAAEAGDDGARVSISVSPEDLQSALLELDRSLHLIESSSSQRLSAAQMQRASLTSEMRRYRSAVH